MRRPQNFAKFPPHRFDWHYIGQIYIGDFAKFCGLLRIYELYEAILSEVTLTRLIDNFLLEFYAVSGALKKKVGQNGDKLVRSWGS